LTVHRLLHIIRKLPQLVAVRRGPATIDAPDRLFTFFVVILNVRWPGDYNPETHCISMYTGMVLNLKMIRVRKGFYPIPRFQKIVKFQGRTFEVQVLFEFGSKSVQEACLKLLGIFFDVLLLNESLGREPG